MSREEIFASIRRGLRRGPLPADQRAMLEGRLVRHPRQLIPARSQLPRPGQLALFIANLEKEFASSAHVPDESGVPGAIADYLAAQNLPPDLAIAPALADLAWHARPMLQWEARIARPSDRVGVQSAFAAVAETGTLMLPGGPATPTTLNIVPETSIVVLRASRIVGAYEEAWDLLRQERTGADGRFMPRNVMLVTGPSRSADIESTLELGAHGPRRLHVVIIDDDPAAIAAQP